MPKSARKKPAAPKKKPGAPKPTAAGMKTTPRKPAASAKKRATKKSRPAAKGAKPAAKKAKPAAQEAKPAAKKAKPAAARPKPVAKKAAKKRPRRRRQPQRGLLISFEGSEGSGKTTQISRLAERFEEFDYEVEVTREPGGTEIGEEIRHLLIHADAGRAMMPETELLLFAASRAQLVRELILPALDEGKIILCDRFLDSTTVYQGVGRQIAAEPVHIINTFAAGDVVPDITIVIDVPADLGLKRIKHRVTDLPDRMESETIDFYRKVREGYLLLAQAIPDRFIVVDGTLPRREIEEEIWAQLEARLR